MALLIHGGDVITPTRVIQDGTVLVDGERIVDVGPRLELWGDPSIDRRLDAGGRFIAPGFIDLQLNGANGRLLTEEPTVEAVLAMAEVLPRFGCTSFLPTVITAPVERLEEAAAAVDEAMGMPSLGARVLGMHLEGPFINPDRSGAHHKAFIISPSVGVFERIRQAGGESLRLLTLAPEMDGAYAVIEAARRHGVQVSLGHSNATPAQVDRAVNSGASLATHLFNAMAQLGSREPGTVGGVLANDQLSASVIADRVHVDPTSLNVAVRAKGIERIVLITDGMPPVGTERHTFTLDGQTIEVRDGACYRPDGVLAGSALTMDRAVRNMCHPVGTPFKDAIRMASLNPARVIGISDHTGVLERGKDADIIIIDRQAEVYMTMIAGEIRYRAPGFEIAG